MLPLLTLENLNYNAYKFNEQITPLMENICQPLFNYFPLNNFGYVKIFNDGKMFRSSTGLEWTKQYFLSQHYDDIDFYDFDGINEGKSKIKTHTSTPIGGVYSQLYSYNIWNIYTIYKKNPEYREVWFFATSKDRINMTDFYFNHQKILEDFIEYFKNKSSSFINDYTSLITTQLHLNIKNKNAQDKNIERFLKEISTSGKIHNYSFSKQEKICLQYLKEGYSAKKIANQLGLSFKTVEFYIQNMRKKAGCNKITKLINIS